MRRKIFDITPDHVKLLRRLQISFNDVDVMIDPKRPFGNSDWEEDIARILEWEVFTSPDEEMILSQVQLDGAAQLRREMGIVLEIVARCAEVKPGRYDRSQSFLTDWELTEPYDPTERVRFVGAVAFEDRWTDDGRSIAAGGLDLPTTDTVIYGPNWVELGVATGIYRVGDKIRAVGDIEAWAKRDLQPELGLSVTDGGVVDGVYVIRSAKVMYLFAGTHAAWDGLTFDDDEESHGPDRTD